MRLVETVNNGIEMIVNPRGVVLNCLVGNPGEQNVDSSQNLNGNQGAQNSDGGHNEKGNSSGTQNIDLNAHVGLSIQDGQPMNHGNPANIQGMHVVQVVGNIPLHPLLLGSIM